MKIADIPSWLPSKARMIEVPLSSCPQYRIIDSYVIEDMQPLADRVVIRRLEDVSSSRIVVTDKPISAKGVVLAVGPGKWIAGEWWKIGADEFCNDHHCDPIDCGCEYHWVPGYRATPQVKSGDTVLFNSKWNDLRHDEFAGSGCDGKDKLERPLSWRFDPAIHLVQEADIFCILPDGKVTSAYVKPVASTDRTIAEYS